MKKTGNISFITFAASLACSFTMKLINSALSKDQSHCFHLSANQSLLTMEGLVDNLKPDPILIQIERTPFKHVN